MLKVEKEVILSNQVECLECGDKPFSSTVHDFKYCKCRAIAVDGGREYLRRAGTGVRQGYKDLSISWPEPRYKAMVELLQPLMQGQRPYALAKAYRNARELPQELTRALLEAAEWCFASRRNVHGVVCAFARVERDGKWVEG